MKAIVVTADKTLELAEVPTPQLRAGEALARTSRSFGRLMPAPRAERPARRTRATERAYATPSGRSPARRRQRLQNV